MPRIRTAAAFLVAVVAAGMVCLGACAQTPEAPPPVSAPAPDWAAVADVETVRVVTRDADGDERDTKVWLVVTDRQGYVRTGSTRWGENLARDPELLLRIEEREYPLAVEFVEDAGTRERVNAIFHEKYGFLDSLTGMVRGSDPVIMRLVPR